ncbi:hypothetical protein LWI28_020067 [Acer negundo]|uniref:Uncharacterized protein n=1 Tax=Acer negundo TaxID=4023 RepID=A0AAD5JJR1_ACENE|nr:hypothetical protein LWI28_020067 [Acer negundo]
MSDIVANEQMEIGECSFKLNGYNGRVLGHCVGKGSECFDKCVDSLLDVLGRKDNVKRENLGISDDHSFDITEKDNLKLRKASGVGSCVGKCDNLKSSVNKDNFRVASLGSFKSDLTNRRSVRVFGSEDGSCGGVGVSAEITSKIDKYQCPLPRTYTVGELVSIKEETSFSNEALYLLFLGRPSAFTMETV